MRKNGFTIIEVCFVILLIFGVTFLVFPRSMESTRQAKFISKWSQVFSELQYTFSVIKAQEDVEKINIFQQDVFLKKIKPYLRIENSVSEDYSQKYMNGDKIIPKSKYFFKDFYFANSGEIIGLKWINEKCERNEICAVMSIDLNGIGKPNIWGYDIFGINIFNNKIEPLGEEVEPEIRKFDCSKHGYGVYCSYYYLIGGKFD